MRQEDIEARGLLKQYLWQYRRARQRQRILKDRRHSLRRELIRGGAGAEQIDRQIQAQLEAEAASALAVVELLALLPADSMERNILELRHVDGKSWDHIASIVHLSRRACFTYYQHGLEQLLALPETWQRLTNFDTIRTKD